jgi:hypothetical protein
MRAPKPQSPPANKYGGDNMVIREVDSNRDETITVKLNDFPYRFIPLKAD